MINEKKYHPKFLAVIKKRFSFNKVPAKLFFIVIGLLSTVWFLVRVIPKPSRAAYPCMRAAYPLMSGFIVYLLGLTAAVFAFKKSKTHFVNAKYVASFSFLVITVVAAIFSSTEDSIPVYANSKLLLPPNSPIGVPKGINPGRVVWVWDPGSTNENIPVTSNERQIFGEGWFLPKHTNMDVVYSMLNDAIKKLAEKNTIKESWDDFFKYFNQAHGKGNVSYQDGEKIFVRTNQVSASGGTYDAATFEIKNQNRYGMAETSPQVMLAVLRNLVNECGVRQENISIGDPMKHMYKHVYDMLHNEFPNVIYIDSDGNAVNGRTKPVQSAQPSIYYSDRGTILKTGGTTGDPVVSDYFPTVITQADYVIGIPALKAHARGGVTLSAKIHFGSNLRGSAAHLHGGLVAPNKENVTPMRTGYGLFRIQVDLLADKYLGGNTVLFIVDGLWAGSEANDPPRKFLMPPFNNDWTSSIFISQDPIALESVGFDFLKSEFTATRQPFYGDYPQMDGADDYLNQAADSSYWPQGFIYDPENDGDRVHSLGVCEHWNNPVDKQYTRNLKTGNGIELVYINKTAVSVNESFDNVPNSFMLFQNYPNPFNPETVISYQLPVAGNVTLKIYNMLGREIATLVNEYQQAGNHNSQFSISNYSLPSGVYFSRLEFDKQQLTKKLILLK